MGGQNIESTKIYNEETFGPVIAVTTYRSIQEAVSYTHLRAHETVLDLVCRLLLEKKKTKQVTYERQTINTSSRTNIANTYIST